MAGRLRLDIDSHNPFHQTSLLTASMSMFVLVAQSPSSISLPPIVCSSLSSI